MHHFAKPISQRQRQAIFMRDRFLLFAIIFLFLWRSPVAAQEQNATLELNNGDAIKCRVVDVWRGEVQFEATSAQQAFEYGETIPLSKIKLIRLDNGQAMTPQQFDAYWNGEEARSSETAPSASSPSPLPVVRASPPPETPLPKEYGPGMRLTQTRVDSSRSSSIGLKLPESPQFDAGQEVAYLEIADLLAASGLAGKLLYEVSAGELHQQHLSASQSELLDALLQSREWALRKQELRDAHALASREFERTVLRDWRKVYEPFQFEPVNEKLAFLEYVQFLHTLNAHKFLNDWEKVERAFDARTVDALLDILNNYDDWYYLYGQELEKN